MKIAKAYSILEKSAGTVVSIHKHYPRLGISADELETALRVVKDVADKATPKMVKEVQSAVDDTYFICPDCENSVFADNYCSNCGQRLAFKDEELQEGD